MPNSDADRVRIGDGVNDQHKPSLFYHATLERGFVMIRYLALVNLTDQGIRNVGDSIQRASSFGQKVEAAGGKLVSQYWAVGEADGCVIFESPDEETAASLLLMLAKDGNVRTRAMRVYDTQEFQQVMSKT